MTPRPGRIACDIAMPLGRDSRLAPPTIQAQRAISQALDDAQAIAEQKEFSA